MNVMWLILCVTFFFGAILASFVGVVAERVYTGQSWLRGRSRCNSCRRDLSMLDLVPVFSWLVSRGRCRTCGSRIPVMYVLFEAALGILFVSSYLYFGFSAKLVVFCLMLVVLCFIVMYDLRHTIVPLTSSGLLALLAVIFAWLSVPSSRVLLEVIGVSLLIGFAFFLLYALSRGRAMGLGDAPIAFSLSLIVGSQSIALAFAGLVFSFWIGAVIGILILVMRRGGPTMGIEVPFVPFLAAGYLLAFFTQWNPFIF